MKYIIGFLRIFVGIFFIISGFIKLNDPVGFSFKLKDYFAPDVLNLEFLVPYALLIAIFVGIDDRRSLIASFIIGLISNGFKPPVLFLLNAKIWFTRSFARKAP